MAKRTAGSELTDRNWDQEDEPEEVGVFAQASTDILKNRPMKKAKRRTPNESSAPSSFSAFGGFAGLATTKPTPSAVENSSSSEEKGQSASNGFLELKKSTANKNTSYYHSLKSLNKSVLEWINKHIERDPYCILTPIFTDYSKHLENIKKNNNNEEKSDNIGTGNDSDPEIVFNIKNGKSLSSFKDQEPSSSLISNTASTSFNLASTSTTASTSDTNVPATTTATSTSTLGFSFTPTTSFGGFGTSAFTLPTNKPADNQDGEEEYEPPKPETREINEEGAVYSKRCKIFYQKDGKWKDRGVGNLHLKPDEEGKTQLIIRADTTLGNILLNIMLSSVIPTKKQGKNNVWMLCVPNPPIDVKDDSGKPVPMLLRVKTSEDADELLDKLEEFKK